MIHGLNFYLTLEFFIRSFLSSNSFGKLFIETNLSGPILESIKALEIKTLIFQNQDW